MANRSSNNNNNKQLENVERVAINVFCGIKRQQPNKMRIKSKQLANAQISYFAASRSCVCLGVSSDCSHMHINYSFTLTFYYFLRLPRWLFIFGWARSKKAKLIAAQLPNGSYHPAGDGGQQAAGYWQQLQFGFVVLLLHTYGALVWAINSRRTQIAQHCGMST